MVGSTAALMSVASAFVLSGCAAELAKEPSEYTNYVPEGSSAGGSGGGGGSTALPCDLDMLFTKSCWGIGCHGSMQPAADLDLQTPGVEGRILNIPASHLHITDGSDAMCVQGELRVDGNNPDNSVILKKINGTQSCGGQMPTPPRTVNDADKACLRAWVFQVAGKDPNAAPTGSGGTGGTGGTGGSGGASGSGGTAGAAAGTGGGGGTGGT
jgi:hypothetical protein